jgi:Domain of unknown function (DUF1772)
MIALAALATILTGLIAGIYVSVLIHDHRIRDLTGPNYAAMHQMRDRTFRRVMPVLVIPTLALLVLNAVLHRQALPGAVFAAAALVSLTDTVLTIRHQLPLNRQVQSWDADHPPTHWADVRDAWARGHIPRIALGATIFLACLWAVILLTINQG